MKSNATALPQRSAFWWMDSELGCPGRGYFINHSWSIAQGGKVELNCVSITPTCSVELASLWEMLSCRHLCAAFCFSSMPFIITKQQQIITSLEWWHQGWIYCHEKLNRSLLVVADVDSSNVDALPFLAHRRYSLLPIYFWHEQHGVGLQVYSDSRSSGEVSDR